MMTLDQAKTLKRGDWILTLAETMGTDGNDTERTYPPGSIGRVESDAYYISQGFAVTVTIGHGDSAIVNTFDEKDSAGAYAFQRLDLDTIMARLVNVWRYNENLDTIGIPPNGDDFNAVLGFLNGASYCSPHVTGR